MLAETLKVMKGKTDVASVSRRAKMFELFSMLNGLMRHSSSMG